MDVSFATTNYNKGDVIERSVRSLLANLPADGELIIVDGGSTDGSLETLERLQEEDDRLRVSVERSNLGRGRTLALERCRGDVVVQLLDTDREYEPSIPEMIETFRQLDSEHDDVALVTLDTLCIARPSTVERVGGLPALGRVDERILIERLFVGATPFVLPVEVSRELDTRDVSSLRGKMRKWRLSARDLMRVGFSPGAIVQWTHCRFDLVTALEMDLLTAVAFVEAKRFDPIPNLPPGPRTSDVVETWQDELPYFARRADRPVILAPEDVPGAIPEEYWVESVLPFAE